MEFAHIYIYIYIYLQAPTATVLDAHLSDICIATSAAPTYLPSHYFTNQDKSGKTEEFNLIDGGVTANNPVSMKIFLCMPFL